MSPGLKEVRVSDHLETELEYLLQLRSQVLGHGLSDVNDGLQTGVVILLLHTLEEEEEY